MLAMIIVRYPTNHGSSAQGFCTIFALFLALCLALWFATKRLPVLSLVIVLVSLLAAVVADRANLMMSYEEWLKRGMPEWGRQAEPKHNPRMDLP